nr:alanine racemase [uncultured Agathobaculum sp.]
MESNKHRIWAEIDLDAIEHNYRVICTQSRAPVLCVVKADAYGHGAAPVAARLQAIGAPYFAVATVPEAIELRDSGITKPILLLGYVDEADMETVARQHITASVYDRETARLLSAAAVRTGEQITVHYKVDTGMTRLGFAAWQHEQTVRDILDCAALPGLCSEGIFTHFAISDVPAGREYTEMQYARFAAVCNSLHQAGLNLTLRHCANSGGIQFYESMHCTMTRAGIILYGYRPDDSAPPLLDLRPAMTVKARVVQVREIPAHTTVSYGRTYETEAPTRIAVVAIGYADGYLRTGSGRAQMVLAGHTVPVLGRVCMDMCMVGLPEGAAVHRGDVATVFGPAGWTAEDVARAAGTISYEVVCAVSSRVPRFYIG